jgi:hypothetical protein
MLALMSFVAWERRGSALFTSRPVEAEAVR